MDTVALQTEVFPCTIGEIIGKSSKEAASMNPAELISLYRAWDSNNQMVEE